MTGQLYINDKDAWNTWRVKLDDGFDSLKLPANPKDYTGNDRRSQPGVQKFVSNTQPRAKEVQLVFAITCDSIDDYLSKFDSFTQELEGTTAIRVTPLKTIYLLTVTDYLSLSSGTGLRDGRLSVRFSEDNPQDRIQL